MITAFGREEVVKQIEKAGVNAFLTKPISTSLMFNTIMETLGHENFVAPKTEPAKGENLEGIYMIEGAKVLLVEDHVLNQQVAREILEGAGIIVEIANNGKEAVDAVSKSEYELVLMDIQMPVMSGYEASLLIRGNDKFKDLPIIAMTAHAMRGAREECLKAGMDDYISKPIDPAELLSALMKWIKPKKRDVIKQDKTKTAQIEDKESDLPENIAGIDIAAGLARIGGNKRLYRQFIIDFSRKYSSIPSEIKNLIETNQLDEAGRKSHTFKGIAGNISANTIFKLANELDLSVKGRRKDVYHDLAEKLAKETGRLVNAIEEWINNEEKLKTQKSIAQNNTKPVDLSDLKTIIGELSEFLKGNNFVGACDSLSKLKTQIGSESFESINKIETLVNDLEFEQAEVILADIILKLNH